MIEPIEKLESRRMFTGVHLFGHTLRIAGTSPAPNVITVGLTPDRLSIEVKLNFTTKKGPQSFDVLYPLTDKITSLNITGGNGADLITVDQTNGSFPVRCNIFAGAGNDTVTGGDEPDRISGQRGNDLLNGGGGNDTIYGGFGNDTLIGGPGNDYLNGGYGHDCLVGGDGNDTLADAFGPDTLLGGAGNNLFIGSVIGRNKTDFDPKRDRVRIVSVSSGTTSTSLLNILFPITSLF